MNVQGESLKTYATFRMTGFLTPRHQSNGECRVEKLFKDLYYSSKEVLPHLDANEEKTKRFQEALKAIEKAIAFSTHPATIENEARERYQYESYYGKAPDKGD